MSTGKNAVVSWDGDIYAALQQLGNEGVAPEVSEEASTDGTGNATVVSDVGAPKWTVTLTMLLTKTDDTTLNAFIPGASGALIVFLWGDASTLVKYTYASAYISRHSSRSGVAEHGKLDVTWVASGAPTIAAVP